jgi:hypothetical protein
MTEVLKRGFTALAWLPMGLVLIVTPVVLYWLFEPMPVTVKYVAPHFVDRPVNSREEAESYAVVAAPGGVELYRYVEYCVDRPFTGTAKRSWVNTAMVWHAPELPTQLSRTVGCRASNIVVEVPTSNPSRTFMFVQQMVVNVNFLRNSEVIEYPPIPLTILASK